MDTFLPPGTIDCDVHPFVPGLPALLPFMDETWRDIVTTRGMDELVSAAYPPNSPLTVRGDWRPAQGRAAASVDALRRECLHAFGIGTAVLHCLYGVQLLFSEDMAAAYARAVNDWIAAEWLAREPRLRASIVVPVQGIEQAVEEIDRCAANPGFAAVLLLAGADAPLGKRQFWPIYAAADRHGLAVAIHAGSSYHNPPTAVGWPSFHAEDYVAHAQAFQTQVTSLICEGVFSRFPALRVVMLESGWTWLPAHLWRLTKYWRGLRTEIPWVDRSPTEIVRSNIRFSLTPADLPPRADDVARLLDHMGSDELLLFSTDYPHAQFEGHDPWPPGFPPALRRRIAIDNPRAAFPRLKEAVA